MIKSTLTTTVPFLLIPLSTTNWFYGEFCHYIQVVGITHTSRGLLFVLFNSINTGFLGVFVEITVLKYVVYNITVEVFLFVFAHFKQWL